MFDEWLGFLAYALLNMYTLERHPNPCPMWTKWRIACIASDVLQRYGQKLEDTLVTISDLSILSLNSRLSHRDVGIWVWNTMFDQ